MFKRIIEKQIFTLILLILGADVSICASIASNASHNVTTTNNAIKTANTIVDDAYRKAKNPKYSIALVLKNTIDDVMLQLNAIQDQETSIQIKQALVNLIRAQMDAPKKKLASYKKLLPKQMTNAIKVDVSNIKIQLDNLHATESYLIKKFAEHCSICSKDSPFSIAQRNLVLLMNELKTELGAAEGFMQAAQEDEDQYGNANDKIERVDELSDQIEALLNQPILKSIRTQKMNEFNILLARRNDVQTRLNQFYDS